MFLGILGFFEQCQGFVLDFQGSRGFSTVLFLICLFFFFPKYLQPYSMALVIFVCLGKQILCFGDVLMLF